MSEYIFTGSRTKLERASKFVEELDAAFIEYAANDPASAKISGTEFVDISWKGLPLMHGAILGDAVHNMRTALDLMASELARLNKKSDKDVYFPFAACKQDFPNAIKQRNFDKCGEDAVTLLMEFSPYRGGNERLRAIHDLDIRDKHMVLLDTEKTLHAHIKAEYEVGKLQDGKVAINILRIDHRFESGPLGGLPVIETLKELVQLVHGIIEAFARLVELRGAK